jgi:putative ABC transport system permease protein
MGWTLVALRRLRSDLAPTVGVILVVLVTALLAALAPRVLASLADAAVRGAVQAAPVQARNAAIFENGIVPPPETDGGDPLEQVHASGADLLGTFPPRVQAMVTHTDAVIDSARFRLQKETTDPAFIRFRIQEGIADHVRYVEGGPPTAEVTTKDDVGPLALDDVPVYETSVAAETARRFGLAVGDEIQLVGDPGDPLLGRTPEDVYAYTRISGIYDVPDPGDDYWFGDPLPIHPVIRALSLEAQLLDGVLLVDPAVHERLAREAGRIERSLGYSWRFTLDTDRITAGNAAALATAFRRLNVRYPSPNITPANDVAVRTGMLPILDGFRASWAAAQSILAVTALGPILVAIATLALIAILAARRRRATMALARSRGATPRQVVWPVVLEGLLVAVPAAVIAVAGAIALIDIGRARPTLVAAAAVVAVAVAVLVATVVPIARSAGPERRAGDRASGRVGARRLVLEALLVGLAIGGAWLLRERGIATTTSTAQGRPAGFDPLIAAVPALVGIAAGIVAVRLFPLVMRAASAIGRRRRGLVGLLATRRAADGGAGSAVLLVLLATATVGAFGAVSLDNLDRGADLAAWQAVGADYRIEAPNGGLPASLDPGALPGAEAVAAEYRGSVEINLTGAQVQYVAVEGGKLRDVLAGTPVAPDLPAGFAEPSNGPIPAIISREVAESARGVKAGDTFNLSIQGYNLPYVAAAVVDDFPGLPTGRGFVVAAREQFLARAPEARLVPTHLLVRAPPSAAGPIREHLAKVAPSITVASQAEDAAARRASPVTGAVRSLVLVAALVTAAYAALGVAAALALAGLARTQETAQLRTLGLSGRQSAALLLAEHGPVTLAAFVAGGLLGAALFALLRPAMGLGTLVGASIDVPVVLEPALLLAILVAMTVVVGFGLWLGAVLQRRVAPVAALRGRFE